jgi:DNA-binding MarR family transcriptional regulator
MVRQTKRSSRAEHRTTRRTRDDIAASVDAFRRVLRALSVAARDTLSTTGISAAQLFVLGTLADGTDASLSELAERTLTDRTSVTVVVDRLVEAGLVVKGIAEDDRRRAAIAITAKGRTVLRRAPRAPTALLVASLESLEPADLRRLATGLQALTREMGLEEAGAAMLFEDGAERPRATTRRSGARRPISRS